MKILIVRFSSIGDIILTSPVIRIAKKQLGAEVHFITKQQYISILNSNPFIDKIYSIKSDVREIIEELRKEHYDYIIDLHNSLRSRILKVLLNKKSFSFNKKNITKWLMVNFKTKNRISHIVTRYIDTLKHFNIHNDNQGLDFFYKENQELFKKYNIPKTYICISLGAKHFTKKIPPEIVRKIILKLNYPCILIGGTDVVEDAKLISTIKPREIIDLTGKISLGESAQIIEYSKLLITSDTGMMHTGAALKKEMIVLWGSTIPEFGMYPYYGNNAVKYLNSEVKNLRCRPCSKIGFSHCPKKHFECMLNQDIEKIINFTQSINL